MLRSKNAFTIIELLVVVAILCILAGMLLPTLSNARETARDTSCKSLLRQYAFATKMYSTRHDGVMPDSYRWADYGSLPQYMMQVSMTGFTRCPGSGVTESLSRMGTIEAKDKDGNTVTLSVSIGANENALSASARPTSGGPKAFWVREDQIRPSNGPANPAKTIIWADWQKDSAGAITAPIVKPGGTAKMGTLCFRHQGHCNAAFLDGHVGTLTPLIETINHGHDLAPGASWGPAGGGALYKCYYPFAPGQAPGGWTATGDFPTIAVQ